MWKNCVIWILLTTGMWQLVSSQSCDLERANECLEELEGLFNETLAQGEHRTEESKVRICTLVLRSDDDMTTTNISSCFLESKATCPGSFPGLQAAVQRWENVSSEIRKFCQNDCDEFENVQECKDKVNISAIEMDVPSEFCRTYGENRDECLDKDYCSYAPKIFDGLFDSDSHKYYYEICSSDCKNMKLDETARGLKECSHYIENPNSNTTCADHRNFTQCLESKSLCPEFPSLILTLYRYDYPGTQRLCQDEACLWARTCKQRIQRQYDETLGYQIIQNNQTSRHLRDLCLISVVENEDKACYTEHIDACSTSPGHPLRAQGTELFLDIQQICDDECENVTSTVIQCHSLVQYNHFENQKWSQFCRSYDQAWTCADDRNCSLVSAMLDRLIRPTVSDLVQSVCSTGCSDLSRLLERLESCGSHLDRATPTCSDYDSFRDCTKHETDFCAEADNIVDFLFPKFSAMRSRCSTTSAAPDMTSRVMTFITATVTSHLLFMIFQ